MEVLNRGANPTCRPSRSVTNPTLKSPLPAAACSCETHSPSTARLGHPPPGAIPEVTGPLLW